jgi:hypothetical protein
MSDVQTPLNDIWNNVKNVPLYSHLNWLSTHTILCRLFSLHPSLVHDNLLNKLKARLAAGSRHEKLPNRQSHQVTLSRLYILYTRNYWIERLNKKRLAPTVKAQTNTNDKQHSVRYQHQQRWQPWKEGSSSSKRRRERDRKKQSHKIYWKWRFLPFGRHKKGDKIPPTSEKWTWMGRGQEKIKPVVNLNIFHYHQLHYAVNQLINLANKLSQ